MRETIIYALRIIAVMQTLPLACMEKLLRQAGAERVSEDAKQALREFLEAQAVELGKRAATLASHAGRKTVKGEDVKLAGK